MSKPAAVEEKKETAPAKAFTTNDLLLLSSNEAFSSIGKMIVSNKVSAPSYGFGTSDRDKEEKRFLNEELSRAIHLARTSPGPNYEVTDKYQYKKSPDTKMGTAVRNTLNTGAKYDFYLRDDIDFDPNAADAVRRGKTQTTRIGLESRFVNDPRKFRNTPGPQYNPSLKGATKAEPVYSFGYRRETAGASPLVLMTSSPKVVGPGKYMNMDISATSKFDGEAKWTFPKDQRIYKTYSVDRNQTYDTKSKAVGVQISSEKTTAPIISFGKASKDYKTGTFKDMMSTKPTQVRISHPKY